jgi:hypothetical protein
MRAYAVAYSSTIPHYFKRHGDGGVPDEHPAPFKWSDGRSFNLDFVTHLDNGNKVKLNDGQVSWWTTVDPERSYD